MAITQARSLRPTTRRPRIELMPLARALDLGDAAWTLLQQRAPDASPFAGWAWHDAWYHAAPDEERDRSFVLTSFDDDGRPNAILPLATRHITFHRARAAAVTWAIDDYGCPDHLDLLATSDAPVAGLASALEALEWDMLQLDGIVEQAPGTQALRDALAARGMPATLRPLWKAPYALLPATWDEYLASRSPARAAVIARRERALARRGRMALTFYGADSLSEGWSHLLRLHDTRWNGAGAFDPRLNAMHRRFAATLAATGRLWLSTIDMDGEPISAWYGFADRTTVYFYQAGRSPEWSKFSVGAVHVGLMIQRAVALGFERFDFLRGDEPYKSEWTDTYRWMNQLVAFRPNARGRVLRLADQAAAVRERIVTRGTA